MGNKRKIYRNVLAGVFSTVWFCMVTTTAACAGQSESGASATRGRYLAGQGIIVPSEEVYTDSYIAAINYQYPQPQGDMGIYLYNSSSLMSRRGQEGILHIGVQGKRVSFAELPPMNLAFVVDTSDSMNEQDKIAWVKESAAVFVNKIRPADSLSLVSFSDQATVLFESTRMDSPEKIRRFLDAVNNLSPKGSTDLEAGLAAGYAQVLANYREGSVNRVLFFSDGTEFSSRLTREGGQSGDVRVSLLWNNYNDLDLHVVTPQREEIFYGHRQDKTGGMLDVDMNAGGPSSNKPIENIFWGRNQAPQGKYRVYVQNYGYHESKREPYSFKAEVKNGNEYSYFEGTVSGAGEVSNTEVCTFTYKGTSALKQEKAAVYQMAESYRQMGISISTLGVGVGFDAELMRRLAEEGGGSSRFISSREEMQKTFDTEFERMAIAVANDLEMELTFMGGVEILETWGYQHRIEGNRIFYKLSGLHAGDYETILVHYKLNPQNTGGEQQLARFQASAKDLRGRRNRQPEKAVNIVLTDDPIDGIASGMVLHSGTMLHYALAMKEIGDLYYTGQDDLSALSALEQSISRREPRAAEVQQQDDLKQNFLNRLKTALQITQNSRSELENARIRLDDPEAFTPELEILARYEEILSKEITDNGGSPAYIAAETPPPEMAELHTKVAGLFQEIGLSFPEQERSVTAVASFGMRDNSEPPLIPYLNESALTFLSANPRLALVERSRLDAVRAEQQLLSIADTDSAISIGKLLGARYMITGQVIPMTSQVIIFGRVINVETGEIISAAQIFVERSQVGELL